MRLSRDDVDDRESESIENQMDIIDNYIKEHDDLEVVEEYIDDGYTGTNFNRTGFKKLCITYFKINQKQYFLYNYLIIYKFYVKVNTINRII